MSGLEVVGVVLGALPLIIAAMDHYKATSQRINWFRFKEPVVAELVEALKEQHFFLKADLQATLKATRLDDAEIAAYLSKPGTKFFDDPSIASEIQKCLGDGYEPYSAAVARCQRILSDIAQRIRGLTSTQGHNLAQIVEAHPVKDGRYEFKKKLKFSLEKTELENRITELNDATQKLRRVRKYSALQSHASLQATSQATARYTRTLESVREYAHRLYQAICRAYVQGCHREHETFLFLRSRSDGMVKDGQTQLRQAHFNFDVAFLPAAPTSKLPANYSITEVKVEYEKTPNATTKDAQSLLISPDTADKRLTIARLSDSIQTAGPTPTVIQLLVPPTPPATAHPQPAQVDDLCRSVSQSFEDGTVLDLYLSPAGCLLCSHPPLKSAMNRDMDAADILSLDQVLQHSPDAQANIHPWTLVQRVSVAFNVASSLLQLHSTQWLTTLFTSKSIYFIAETIASSPGCSQATNPPKPFIIHRFQGTPYSTTTYPNARRSLLELGIILLELWLSRTLDSYAAENKLPSGDAFGIRYDIARKWLDSSAHLMLPFYHDVVSRCVECTFVTSSAVPQWDDVVFRKSICEHVLKPLWKSCQPGFR